MLQPMTRKYLELKTVIIFMPINLNIGFGCFLEQSQRVGSFEYTEHLFWFRNKNYGFM